jgi:hypothetical protein
VHHLSAKILATVLLLACAAAGSAQMTMPSAPPAATGLPRLLITADLLNGLPRRSVTVSEEDGSSATYSGVDLGLILAKNGAPHGPTLRGAAAADYALVTATDGYRAVFALAELDAGLTDKVILLADARDGKPLEPKYGPFQIIIPDEKHRVRWVRNVREIDVAAAL